MSKLLINENPLTVLPSLVKLIGLNEAIVLQQIRYWLFVNEQAQKNYREGRYWTYNTQKAWLDQFPWLGLSTLKSVLKKLRSMNLVISKAFEASKHDQTLWYTIDYEAVERLLETPRRVVNIDPTDESNFDHSESQHLTVQAVKSQPISTETNNRDYTETNSRDKDSGPQNADLFPASSIVSLPDRSDPEVSVSQLTLVEVQSTSLGKEGSEPPEGAKVPPAISPIKKFEAFKNRFKATYNDRKPASFARIDVMNESRCKVAKGFLKDMGDDEESALLALSNALDYAASDPWYCSRNLSFENFSSNGKILQLHEKQVSRGSNGFRFATEREAKMAQTYNRYAGYMANRSLDHAS